MERSFSNAHLRCTRWSLKVACLGILLALAELEIASTVYSGLLYEEEIQRTKASRCNPAAAWRKPATPASLTSQLCAHFFLPLSRLEKLSMRNGAEPIQRGDGLLQTGGGTRTRADFINREGYSEWICLTGPLMGLL